MRRGLPIRLTPFGWTLSALILIAWLMAINFSNNLLYAVVCLWLSLLITSALLAWLAFRQVRILGWQHDELFAHRPNSIRLSVDRAGFAGRLSIGLDHPQQREECLWQCAPPNPGRQSLQPPPLWAWDMLGLWQLSRPLPALTERVVYAQPIAHVPLEPQNLGVVAQQEPDDIAGLRDYQAGDAWRRIDWKASARRGGLVSRQWQGAQSADLHVLRWQALAPLPPRQRQETLSAWVIGLFECQQGWSLQLPNLELDADAGWSHRQRSLTAIAEVTA
jgi:uncharacterized protein (DUF58 family)